MKFESKFNINDKVYLLKDNKIILREIYYIKVSCGYDAYKGKFDITYFYNLEKKDKEPEILSVEEKYLFKSKEDLINYMMKEAEK